MYLKENPIDRTIKETEALFDDKAHIIYVNRERLKMIHH